MANTLSKFIADNKLSAEIAGKSYVMVEGWQFAGSQLGLVAIITETENISDDKEVKYRSICEVRHAQTGMVVSQGFAVCSNKESKKRSFDEYAVASMAQTRAIGKAYRNILAWLVRASGFETTPADEVNKETMEDELAKLKKEVFKAFGEAGVSDSSEMIDKIKEVTGKAVIETADDARQVIDSLKAKDETL